MTQWQRICLPLQKTQETWVQPLGWEDPLEGKWQPTPVENSRGKPRGQRSLAGCSAWGRKQSYTQFVHTQGTHFIEYIGKLLQE